MSLKGTVYTGVYKLVERQRGEGDTPGVRGERERGHEGDTPEAKRERGNGKPCQCTSLG